MAHTGLAALLLFLGLVVPSAYAADPLCDVLNATATNTSSAFSLSVSPDTLSVNKTDFTVTVTGSGNATVILQALIESNSVGNWSESNTSCNGSPLFTNDFANGSSIQANWTSPENVTSVNISAHIHYDNMTFILVKQISRAENSPTTGPTTTEMKTNSVTTTTKAPPTTTHSGASSVQTSLISVAFLGLLTVTIKYLS